MIKRIIKKFLYKTGLKIPYVEKTTIQNPDLTYLNWEQLFSGTDLVCVDVGGANDLPANWSKIANYGRFIVYEPDERSYEALMAGHRKNFLYIPQALSKEGGIRKFNLYNTPTGSTFYNFRNRRDIHLEVSLPANDYVHPIKEIEISTTTLKASLSKEKVERIDMIKLDVQGAELEILEGLDNGRWESLLCCEAEVNFHDIYDGGSTYESVNKKLTEIGFRLFDLRVARYYKIPSQETDRILTNYFNTKNALPSLAGKIWEADHVYMRDAYWALDNFSSVEELKRLVIVYCVYNFFVDAIDICERWQAKYPESEMEIQLIIQSIVILHQAELDNLGSVNALLQSNGYQNWGQYEWVPYPSS